MSDLDRDIVIRLVDETGRLTELVLETVRIMKEMGGTITLLNQRISELEVSNKPHEINQEPENDRERP